MGNLKDIIYINCAKYIIIGFNLIILILAIVMVSEAEGFQKNSHISYLDLKNVTTFAIALGSITIFLTILVTIIVALPRFWEPIRKNDHNLIYIYAGVLLCFFVIQLALAILAYVAPNQESQLDKIAGKYLSSNWYDHTQYQYNTTIKELQQTMHCCGIDGPKNPIVQESEGEVIAICCEGAKAPCPFKQAYQDGCSKALREIALGDLKGIGIIATISALLELIYAIFIICIRHGMKKNNLGRPYT